MQNVCVVGASYINNSETTILRLVILILEFKQQVVNSYLKGEKTYQSVAQEHGIFAPTTVRQWVMM